MDFFLLEKHLASINKRKFLSDLIFNSLEEYKLFKNDLLNGKENINISFMGGSFRSFFLKKLLEDVPIKNFLLITSEESNAQEIYYELLHLIPKHKVIFFQKWNHFYKMHISPSKSNMHHRMESLYYLLKASQQKENCIFISSIINFSHAIIGNHLFKNLIYKIKLKDFINFSFLKEKLFQYGYQEDSLVNFPGSFSFKGSIIDIYPRFYDWPYRLEFFGEELISLRQFHPRSQESIAEKDLLEIFPISEFSFKFFSESFLKEKKEFLLEKFKNILSNDMKSSLQDEKMFSGIENYITHFYTNNSLFDYFDPKETYIIFLDSFSKIQQHYEDFLNERENQLKNLFLDTSIQDFNFETWQNINSFFFNLYSKIKVEKFDSSFKFKTLINELTNETTLNFSVESGKNYQGNFNFLQEDLKNYVKNSWKIFILCSSFEKARAIFDLFKILKFVSQDEKFELEKLYQNTIYFDIIPLLEGFQLSNLKILILLDGEILGKKKSYFSWDSTNLEDKKADFFFLRPQEYVVHLKYGIGKYLGLETKTIQNQVQDFLVFEYEDNARFLTSIQDLPFVQKYIGSNQSQKAPKLDKLSKKNSWEKTKGLIQERVEKIAQKIFQIYLNRLQNKGFPYPKDDLRQFEFEADFEYEETIDQLKAIQDVKADLESTGAMDRLICGDVGFGKTEVAMRAAFKVTSVKRQVVVLVPTVILCQQHYKNFKKRYKKFPEIKINSISRLNTLKEQKLILKDLMEGNIDILIGTHRLLSKDIKYPNLGLVIIDEEHRFGVKDKEILRELTANLEILSLSATPIPRTMNMTMIKIRDISLIQTPPHNRVPVDTFVLEWNLELLKDIFKRELDRQGQIFLLYNDIKNMPSFMKEIQSLNLELSIAYIHGRMAKEAIQNVLNNFLEKKYNLLITTTIIESGIDISNANSMIIYNADRFGLTQLYQLRGRVGRSNKKAYCYLFYNNEQNLNSIAEKRLRIIEESNDFGSGYYIAYKDMEIRGVGDVFGYDQSGNISRIEYELFLRFLFIGISKFSDRFKNFEYQMIPPVFINLGQDEWISDHYIPNEQQKLSTYRKIYQIFKMEDIPLFKKQLIDQFGAIPVQLSKLLELIPLRIISRDLGIQSIVSYPSYWAIRWSMSNSIESQCEIITEGLEKYISNLQFQEKQNLLHLKKTYLTIELNFEQQLSYLIDFLQTCFTHKHFNVENKKSKLIH